MKKIFKGCLLTIAILFGLLLIGGVVLYVYLDTPNKIEYVEQPISYETVDNKLDFDGVGIPDVIKNQSKETILYQAIYKSSFLHETVIYKQINKTNREVKLENKLPITPSDIKKIDNNGFLSEITSNPMFEIPNDNKISSGNSLIIYSKIDSVFFNFKKGYYSISYYEIDKVGGFGEIIVYDKESELLYVTRTRYFAFQ